MIEDATTAVAVPESTAAVRTARVSAKPDERSFHREGSFLFEEVQDEGEPSFVAFNCRNGETSEIDEVPRPGGSILPLTGEELKLGAVVLPSGVAEYGDTTALLAEIDDHIYRYLDISASFRKFAAYYVLLSWLYDRLTTLPYLRALGDTGCGKSRLLDVVGRLCYKPTIVSGCITPAPIYRMIRRWGGTIILDEADLKGSDEYNEVVTILNCGFETGRPVIRATKDNPDRLQFLPTFGPKVFATRRKFKDAALEARCLTEVMQETMRSDICPILPSRFFEEQGRLRNKLLLFRFRNWHGTDSERAATLDLGHVEPRLRQVGSAFGAVFANVDDVLDDFRTFIQDHQRELVEQRAATFAGRIVEVLFELIETATDATTDTIATRDGQRLLPVSAHDIAQRLGDTTAQNVGQVLRALGLESKQKKINGEVRRLIVHDDAKLDTLRRRYIPAEDVEVAAVADVASVADDRDRESDANE